MRIKLVVFDIDGVLTDGMVLIDSQGNEMKRFRLTEIDAINDIVNMGVKVAAITGEDTPIVDYFKKKVKWDFFESGCKNKLSKLKIVLEEIGLEQAEVCYIGDGKYDIECIRYAGLGVCPQNAIQEVKDIADVVLVGKGGEACIYELYQLLKGRNEQ